MFVSSLSLAMSRFYRYFTSLGKGQDLGQPIYFIPFSLHSLTRLSALHRHTCIVVYFISARARVLVFFSQCCFFNAEIFDCSQRNLIMVIHFLHPYKLLIDVTSPRMIFTFRFNCYFQRTCGFY